jgi:hypothetical protein
MPAVGSRRPQGGGLGRRCHQDMGLRRGILVVSIALASVIVASLPAGAAIPKGRFGVGDSIMLSSSDELAPYGVGVDAEVGRQFSEGLPVVRRLVRREELPRNLIVHLGTNGYVQPEDCDKLVALAPGRRIFLTSIRVPRDWQDPNNDVLNACAARYDRVFMLRWAAESRNHPEWFASDGYHLNATGQQAYADLLYGDVREVLRALRRR